LGPEAKRNALLRDHRFVTASEWLAAHEGEVAGRVFDVRAQLARLML